MSGLGAYRLFRVTVKEAERITPGFVRITFAGDDLDHFGFVGIDQRVKVLLPNSHGEIPQMTGEVADWYAQWCELSEADQPPMRTYTPRHLRRSETGTTLVIDFAWHDNPGPAAAWAATAKPGDVAAVVGPNGDYSATTRAVGWVPPVDASKLLLVGDETAFPAIAAILESLDPSTVDVRVIVELSNSADVTLLAAPAGVRVDVHERGDQPYGDALVAAVAALDDSAFGGAAFGGAAFGASSASAERPELEDVNVDETILWEVPGLDAETGQPLAEDTRSAVAYAWLAGESDAIKRIRRILVGERGMARDAVAFMGYWRLGRAER